jgi:hypothetical protein
MDDRIINHPFGLFMTSYLNNGYYDQKKFTTTLPVGSYLGLFLKNKTLQNCGFTGHKLFLYAYFMKTAG